MAIDTRDKRASAAGIALVFLLQPPLADGALNQGDRQQATNAYRGVLAAGAVEPAAEQPAGRASYKKRWAVEVDGKLVEFSTAQAALGWLGRQNKKIKQLSQQVQSAAPKEEPPAPIPFTAITFDGMKLNRMMVDGEKALDRIRTMKAAEIEMVERHIQELQEEESLIMRFIELLD